MKILTAKQYHLSKVLDLLKQKGVVGDIVSRLKSLKKKPISDLLDENDLKELGIWNKLKRLKG